MISKMITNVEYFSPNVLTLVFNDGSRLMFNRNKKMGQRRYANICALAGLRVWGAPHELIGKRVNFDETPGTVAPTGEPTPEPATIKRTIVSAKAHDSVFVIYCEPSPVLRLAFDMRKRRDNDAFGELLIACGMTKANSLDELIGREFEDYQKAAARAPTPEVVEALAPVTYRIIIRPGGRIGTYTTHGVYDDKHALIAEFTDPDDAQVFVNAKRFIDEVLAQRRLTITDAGRMLLASTTKERK